MRCFVFQVYVDVADADDVTPTFRSDVIRLEFREDIPVSTILYAARAAVGANANCTVSYSLEFENNDDGCFSVDRWTGEIRLRRALDREIADFHRFSIAATTDNGYTGYLNVTITVLDSNDHNPVFSQSSYSCHVTSNTSGYYPVCTVTATDLDEKENGRIVYFLLADDDALDVFYINPHNGAIYANRSAPGNRTLTVVATDAGALPRKSSALVVVTSDVLPTVNCAVDSMEMKIEENQPAYSIVGSVHLMYDDGTNVAVTRYQLIEDGGQQNFDVDVKTGEIATKSILDRELSNYHTLSVFAVYSLPGLLSSHKKLCIQCDPKSQVLHSLHNTI